MKISCMMVIGYLTAAVLSGVGTVHGQVVIQHSNANDPLEEGFFKDEFFGINTQVVPVIDDMGFDAWSINTMSGAGATPLYRYDLSVQEHQSAVSTGWVLSGRMRLVESGIGALKFSIGTRSVFLGFWLRDNGDIEFHHHNGVVYTLAGGGHDYHEYSVIYDAMEQVTSLWVTGVGRVADLFSGEISPNSPMVQDPHIAFGLGQGRSHAHWNEFTFEIIPEPATVALLSGLGALGFVVGLRWRRRRTAGIT